MRTGEGTVSLDGGLSALTDMSWNDEKTVCTVPYSGLDIGTAYIVTISGFKDYSGNVMAPDTSNTFSTAPSNDASLSGLSISEGVLTPVFASGTYGYTASVANSVGSVTVTPTAGHAGATIRVNGNSVISGAASDAISLAVGSNTVEIVVTAQDGTTTRTYTVTVMRSIGGYVTYTDASVFPTEVNYDNSGFKDISITLDTGSYTLQSLKNGPVPLEAGADYLISGRTAIIKAAYPASLTEGEHSITFQMSG